MSESQTDTEREKLRAFEQKMHDEGAAGFADGPSPWETWDDESGPQANKRIWEGKSKRIFPKKHPQQSLGDRVLSGLAMLSLATMVVGIAGVYFSDQQPRQVVATGIQPLPIDRTPPAADSAIATLVQMPPTAAGYMASGTDRNGSAPPAPAILPEPKPVIVAIAAPTGDSAVAQAPALPVTAAASHMNDVEDSAGEPATRPALDGGIPPVTGDSASSAGGTGIDSTALTADPMHSIASDTFSAPAQATSDADIKPATLPASVTTAPVTVTVTVTTGTEANVTTETLAVTAAGNSAANDHQNTMAAVETETGPVHPTTAATTDTDPDAEATIAGQQPLPASAAATAPDTEQTMAAVAAETASDHQASVTGAETDTADDTIIAGTRTLHDPAAASSPEPGTDTLTDTARAAPAAETPVETMATTAVADTAAMETTTDIADTVASLDALPATMARAAVTADTAPIEGSEAMSPPAATDTVVAIAIQGDGTTAAGPAEAAEEIVPASKTGAWVVNLASYTRKSTASRMLAEFRAKGVDAELVSVMINDKPMHRVRVAGFATSRVAKASIDPLQQQLGLEGVWISRK